MPTSPSIDAHIGQRIRLLRGVRKLSQEKLATALGITFQQVQKYERGTNRVGAGRLYEMARILSVPIGFFFDDFQHLMQSDSNARGLSEEQELFSSSEKKTAPPYGMGELELLMRQETLTLAQAYYRITDEKIRQNVLNLIRNISTDAPKSQ